METIDQLTARHAAELAALQNQAAIRDRLSLGPDSLMDTKGLGWWATYKCQTLAQVADIVREFGPLIVPTVEWRNGCLSRMPLELYKERDRAKAADEGREVVFSLNGTRIGATAISIPAGGSTESHLALNGQPSGRLAASVNDRDGYAADNVRYAVLDPADAPLILAVTASGNPSEAF